MRTRVRLWMVTKVPIAGQRFQIDRTIEGRPHPDSPEFRKIEHETGATIEACQNLGPG